MKVGQESEILSSKTSLGLRENIEGCLCYTLTWLTGLVFFVLETKSRFVRFHAMQSFLTFAVLSMLISILQTSFGVDRFIDYFLINLNPLLLPYLFLHNPVMFYSQLLDGLLVLSLIPFLLWLFLIYAAYRGIRYRLPLTGDLAEKIVGDVYKP